MKNMMQDSKDPCALRGHCSGLNTGKCKADQSMRLCMLPKSACGKTCAKERHPGECFTLRNQGFCRWKNCSYRHEWTAELPGDAHHMVLLASTGSGGDRE